MAFLFQAGAAFLLFSGSLAQTFNSWPQVFTNSDALTDGDISTYFEQPLPTYDYILFNGWERFAGFYIQSSGDFITDYYVTAVVDYPLSRLIQAGQVCGATSNFTLVLFTDENGEPSVYSDSYFLQVTGSKGNTSIINEIWPIYPGDTIYYPDNTVACPTPTPTVTSTTTSATPTPTIPASISVSHWKSSNSPIPVALSSTGHSNAYSVDNKLDTYWSYPVSSANSASVSFSLLFNNFDVYQGFYIVSMPGAYITDYSITSWNNTAGVDWTLGQVSNATSELTLVRFNDVAGTVGPISVDEFFMTITGAVGGVANINEVYPIYAGDTIVEP